MDDERHEAGSDLVRIVGSMLDGEEEEEEEEEEGLDRYVTCLLDTTNYLSPAASWEKKNCAGCLPAW